MAKLTATELAVVDGLVEFSALGKKPTLSDIANECNVAKSTVIKTLQKLGYSGFQDFAVSYSVRASSHHDSIFPKKVVEGSFSDASKHIANSLAYGIGRKNLVSPVGSSASRPVAEYFSRKLEMFEIFAPVTYDYVMFDTQTMRPGTMYVFLHLLDSVDSVIGDPREFLSRNIELASEHGFKVFIFTDAEYSHPRPNVTILKIAKEDDPNTDLFFAKVLTVFESALARFSSSISQEVNDNAR